MPRLVASRLAVPAGRIASVASDAGQRVDAALHHAVAAPDEHEVGALLDALDAPASAPACSSAPRTRSGRRRRACASTRRSSPRPPPSDFPGMGDDGDGGHRTGSRSAGRIRAATATARTDRRTATRAGERAEQHAARRRRSGSACRGRAGRPIDEHGRERSRRSTQPSARSDCARVAVHDQATADVEHDGGGRVPRREARGRWRGVEPVDRRAAPGRRRSVVVRNTVTSSTSAVTRNADGAPAVDGRRGPRRRPRDADDGHRFGDVRSEAREVVRRRVAMVLRTSG